MIQDFETDLSLLCDLIKSNESFAFLKCADGEASLMKGLSVGQNTQAFQQDKWSAPENLTELGKDLLKAIANNDPRVYIGISCDCCDPSGKEYLWGLIKNKKENVTFSNIFINSNYQSAINFFLSITEPINLIANYRVNVSNFPLNIKSYTPIPDNCVAFYENFKDYFLKVLDKFKQSSNELFIISAGPLSEVIIDYLWKINPTNKYVDVGSAIGEWIHGQPIRHFSLIDSPYRHQRCFMHLPDK